jgi:hypothetical protein
VGACVVNQGLLEVWTVWWCLEFKNRDVQAHMSCHQRVLSLKPASQLPRSWGRVKKWEEAAGEEREEAGGGAELLNSPWGCFSTPCLAYAASFNVPLQAISSRQSHTLLVRLWGW